MKAKLPDVRRWDVAVQAAQAATFEAETLVRDLPRVAADDPQGDATVRWRAEGEQRLRMGGRPQVWLRLRADADVTRTCQRCLEPMQLKLNIDRQLRFVRGEAEAARLDAEGEDDVLALEPSIDLLSLLEDELLLAMPVISMHPHCDPPLAAMSPDHEGPAVADSPFAALAQWKPDVGKH